MTVLTQAAAAFQANTSRPSAELVVRALLQAEKATKQERVSYPFESLWGHWRLCFATGTRKARRGGIVLGKGFYVPQFAVAQISFGGVTGSHDESGKGTIGNQVEVGPVRLRFTGPARYRGQKNLLAFDFTQLQIGVLGKTVYDGGVRGGTRKTEAFDSQSIARLPFFAFFIVTPDFIAARGRGGGLAIWVKQALSTDDSR